MSSSKLGNALMSKWNEEKRSKGHFAVYAEGGKRFVLPLKFLKHPICQVLLEMAEEEYGSMGHGRLRVPCDEELMEHIVLLLKTQMAENFGKEGILSH